MSNTQMCDDPFEPCEVVKLKTHVHDNAETWLFEASSLADLGLQSLAAIRGCGAAYEKRNWQRWFHSLNTTRDFAGGSADTERHFCEQTIQYLPQLQGTPIGVEPWTPGNGLSSVDELKQWILANAERSGAKLLFKKERTDFHVSSHQTARPMEKYSFRAGAVQHDAARRDASSISLHDDGLSVSLRHDERNRERETERQTDREAGREKIVDSVRRPALRTLTFTHAHAYAASDNWMCSEFPPYDDG